MSFSIDNRYFIASLQRRLNPLAAPERATAYRNEFQSGMRNRIFTAHKQTNSVQELTNLYRTLLTILNNDELDWILWSLFFEREAEAIIIALSADFHSIGLNKLGQFVLGSQLFLGELPLYDHNLLKGYLKDFFYRTLLLDDKDWEEKDSNRNPLDNLLEKHLVEVITADSSKKQELKLVILNYVKLWDIYYSLPFVPNKGSVLLHKLTKGYQKIDKLELKLNLFFILGEIEIFLADLLPRVPECPLIGTNGEISSFIQDQTTAINTYQIKKRAFFKILRDDQVHFQDLSLMSISQMMVACTTAEKPTLKAYFKAIDERTTQGQLPLSSELNDISNHFHKKEITNPEVKALFKQIIRDNYIFF